MLSRLMHREEGEVAAGGFLNAMCKCNPIPPKQGILSSEVMGLRLESKPHAPFSKTTAPFRPRPIRLFWRQL